MKEADKLNNVAYEITKQLNKLFDIMEEIKTYAQGIGEDKVVQSLGNTYNNLNKISKQIIESAEFIKK